MVQGYNISTKYWLIFSTVLWLLIRFAILLINKKNGKSLNFIREIKNNLFVIYIFSFIGITLFPITIYFVKQRFYIEPTISLIPFLPIINDVSHNAPLNIILFNIVGNIILTVPFGIFLPMLWKKNFKSIIYIVGFGIVSSFTIEVLQFIEGKLFPSLYTRSSDIDDIIFNTLGVVMGYLVYKIYNFSFKKEVNIKN